MAITTFTIDPEFKSLIPPLTADEISQLETNLVQSNGARDGVVVWAEERILLDGHHRVRLCGENDLPRPAIIEMSFPDRPAAMRWVLENQFGRRNLTDFQRGEIALKLKPVLAAEAKERQEEGGVSANLREGRTDTAIAKKARVSEGTIRKVEAIKETATPALIEMARADEVSIDAAAKVATLPKPEQKKLVKAGPAAVKAKAAEIRKAPKAPAEPPPAEEPTDELGTLLPDRSDLREAFVDRKLFVESENLLTQIASRLNKLMGDIGKDVPRRPGAAELPQTILQNYKNLRDKISHAKPHAVCPHCRGKGCPASMGCRGKGWFTESQYDNAPSELKKGGAK